MMDTISGTMDSGNVKDSPGCTESPTKHVPKTVENFVIGLFFDFEAFHWAVHAGLKLH